MSLLTFNLGNNLISFFGHLFVDVLPLLVVLINMLCLVQSIRQFPFNQKVYTFTPILHPSGRIDTWTYLKYNVAHRQRTPTQSANINYGFKPDTRILIELFQTMVSQYTVLINYRDYIGRNTNGTQVEQWYQTRKRYAVILSKSLHEFKADTATAQMLERISIIFTFRVKDSYRLWHLLVRHMMVTDDEVYPQALSICNLLHCLNSAIKDNNKFNACFLGVINSLVTYSITFVVTVGNVIIYV